MKPSLLSQLIEAITLSDEWDTDDFLLGIENQLKSKAALLAKKMAENGDFKKLQILSSALAANSEVGFDSDENSTSNNARPHVPELAPFPRLTPDCARLAVLELYSSGERHKKKDLPPLFYQLLKSWNCIGEAEEQNRTVVAKDGSTYQGRKQWLEALDSAVFFLTKHRYLEYIIGSNKYKNRPIQITAMGATYLELLRQELGKNSKANSNGITVFGLTTKGGRNG